MSQSLKARRTRGAVLLLVVIILPILLALAAFAVSVSYVQMARSELQASVDAATLAGAQTICDLTNINLGDSPACGSAARWNGSLDTVAGVLSLHRVHGSPESTKKFPPLPTTQFNDPRNIDNPGPDTPSWSQDDMSVTIERGRMNKERFESLEGARWQSEHPGVLKYLLFSAIRVTVSRRISIFSWFGIKGWEITAKSLGTLPRSDVFVAPFALPLCSVLDTAINSRGELSTAYSSTIRCQQEILFTGTSRAGTFVTPSDCSPEEDCCPPEGCLSVPEFTWSLRACWNHLDVDTGVCNWASPRTGTSPRDRRGIASNFGFVGLPLTKSEVPQGFYHRYDPIQNPQETYYLSDVHEGTIKDILNGNHGGVPLVRAGLGWGFAALPDGLTGATDDLPGGRIDDVVWNQINKIPAGGSGDPLCASDVDAAICNHPSFSKTILKPLGESYSSTCPQWPIRKHIIGWSASACPGKAVATQGLCRSRMYPNLTFLPLDGGAACSADVSTPTGSMWQALVPILADTRKSMPDTVVQDPCSHPPDTTALEIIGFARINFFDVDINNGIYPAPDNCPTQFRNPGDVSVPLDRPVWGFSNPVNGVGCNIVRARLSCASHLVASADQFVNIHPGHLEHLSD